MRRGNFFFLIAIQTSFWGAYGVPRGNFKYDEYKVLFTNPVCKLYTYGEDQEVVDHDGDRIIGKPKDVFCTHADAMASGQRAESPQSQLIEWIRSPETEEIFFTYLTFSNSHVRDALCEAVESRNVKITFILDSKTPSPSGSQLASCKPKSGRQEDRPRMLVRGNAGGIDLAHNKLFIVNPNSAKMRIAFSSGNLTSGAVLHHENWHFITVKDSTYFAKVHRCLMKGMIEHGGTRAEFGNHLNSCRANITEPEESDIKAFFAPAEGAKALRLVKEKIESSYLIDIAAHRFSHAKIITSLSTKLLNFPETSVRMIADDDLYWVGLIGVVFSNDKNEHDRVQMLERQGMNVKYFETNHRDKLLHHNKFMIFNDRNKASVFCGAGNFTTAAFSNNFENFYYIEIPEVVETFRVQYRRMWETMATDPRKMPTRNVFPKVVADVP